MDIKLLEEFFDLPVARNSATFDSASCMALAARHQAILRLRESGKSYKEIQELLRDPITEKMPTRGQLCRMYHTALRQMRIHIGCGRVMTDAEITEKIRWVMA